MGHEFLKNGFIKRIENERTEEIGSMISYSKDGEWDQHFFAD